MVLRARDGNRVAIPSATLVTRPGSHPLRRPTGNLTPPNSTEILKLFAPNLQESASGSVPSWSTHDKTRRCLRRTVSFTIDREPGLLCSEVSQPAPETGRPATG